MTHQTLECSLRIAARQHILQVLKSSQWNVSEAARLLDVGRSTVYRYVTSIEIARARLQLRETEGG